MNKINVDYSDLIDWIGFKKNFLWIKKINICEKMFWVFYRNFIQIQKNTLIASFNLKFFGLTLKITKT